MVGVPRWLPALVAAAALLAGLPSGVAGQAPLTTAEFRDVLAAAVKARYPRATVTPTGETTLEIATPEGARGRVDIRQPYSDYLGNPGARDSLLDRYTGILEVALSTTPLVSVATLATRVVPTNLGGYDEAAGPVVRPLAGDIASRLVFALKNSSKFATMEDLAALNLTPDQAWELAAVNDSGRPALRTGQLATRSRADAVMGDNAFARLIADPATCGRAGEGKGDPRIFLMLASGAYAVGDPRRPESMKRFWSEVREIETKPSAESRTPITCAGGQWTLATPR